MQLVYTDGRSIGEVTNLKSEREIGHAPVEFSAELSEAGVAVLSAGRAAFYRAATAEARFTLTIDTVKGAVIAGTIRRR